MPSELEVSIHSWNLLNAKRLSSFNELQEPLGPVCRVVSQRHIVLMGKTRMTTPIIELSLPPHRGIIDRHFGFDQSLSLVIVTCHFSLVTENDSVLLPFLPSPCHQFCNYFTSVTNQTTRPRKLDICIGQIGVNSTPFGSVTIS
jgi:hypothetical protein